MTDLDLGAIRARLEAAKKVRHYEDRGLAHREGGEAWSVLYEHAPTDIPALLAEVERLRGELSGKTGELQPTDGARVITDEMVERAAKELNIHRHIRKRRSPDAVDRAGRCTCGAEGIGDPRAFALHRARAALEAALGVEP